MKPYLFFFFLAFLAITGLSSCKEIFEPDIKNHTVQLQAPGNGSRSPVYLTYFWWDEVPDALTYRLQVVSPTFNAATILVLDTVVRTTQFTISLAPGDYQWHVQALNASSKTAYSTPRSFTVLQSSIKTQRVQLTSPANNTLTALSAANFNWSEMYGATKYRLQIDTNNFADETKLIYNQTTPAQQFNFTFPKDQVYQWRVRAENDTAQALWSTINNITYDHTPPAKVTLTAPNKNQTVSLPVSLQWSATQGAAKYRLYLLKSDSTTNYSNSFPLLLNSSAYSLNQGNTGEKLYWKITAVDAAGNESLPSELRNFTVQ